MNNIGDIRVLLTSLDDNDFEIVFIVFSFWRQQDSHFRRWLMRKRLTLQRIVEEQRIGIETFIDDILPRYHNIQFKENFRMAKATFEVII